MTDSARAKAGVLSKSGVSNLGSPNNAQTFSYTASQERFALMGWHKHALRRGLHFIAIRENYHQLGSGLNAQFFENGVQVIFNCAFARRKQGATNLIAFLRCNFLHQVH